jgi:hypothetical protein
VCRGEECLWEVGSERSAKEDLEGCYDGNRDKGEEKAKERVL